MIVMAVASSFVRSTSRSLKGIVTKGQIIVDVAKGIEDDTFYTMTEIIEEELPECEAVVLSGPSHAEEVGRNVPTVVVIGAKRQETAVKVRDMFANKYFRTYISPDRKLSLIHISRGCKRKGNQPDLEKTSGLLLDDFRNGKLGRITLERAEDA